MSGRERFKGRNILITGGARGQGAEEARRLCAEGARVFITDVLDAEGEALARELGDRVSFSHHDVSSEADWRSVCDEIRLAGGLHGLVNNAGIFNPLPIADTSAQSFEAHFRVNQLGCFLGMKLGAEVAAPEGASFVNISSIAGLRGTPGIAYTGTKWALRGMTKTAAVELAPRKIRVNSVHPGLIDTPMLDVMEPERRQKRVGFVPLGRSGTVEDVADLVLFLLSDESSYITGAEIAVDGGITL
ncbi:MAG: SDR family oxidoreductase [Rhodobiaceae bacterium]|nr:SDR family oxidoreductase [Rhodobiaceae bacterium]MCC0054604.1 SDR family oxidoreductase [Rhodobiaceae bacterium]